MTLITQDDVTPDEIPRRPMHEGPTPRMNLAFLTRRYGKIGGTERDLHELTTRLVARGHEVHIYCVEARMEPPSGIHVHRVPVLGFGRLARFFSIAWLGPKRARKGGHDVLIAYERAFDQDIARCGGGTHKRFLERMAEKASPLQRFLRGLDPYHRLVLRTERKQFANCRRAHAVSRLVKDELVEVYGVAPDKVDLIYCGVDTDRFHPDNRATLGAEVRQQLGIADDAKVALFLGNGFKRKGLDLFLAGLAQSKDLVGLVVGTDSQQSHYEDQAKRLGTPVHFAGQQSETWRYYAAADAFVLPSVQEAFGIVVLEAMATGLPCLVSARAGAAEVLPEAMRPYLLDDPYDAAEMAGKLSRALADAELGAACREAALGYSLDEHTRVSEELYSALCAQ